MATPRTPADQAPVQAVENPILCSPYREPHLHWRYDTRTGSASRQDGRREASYWFKSTRTGTRQTSLLAEEERADLPLVNWLREDIRAWRKGGYRGATNVTKDLLAHWGHPDRGRKLFFCQREAVETIIFLSEIVLDQRPDAQGRYRSGSIPACVRNRLERQSWTLPAEAKDEWSLEDPRRFYARPLDALLDSPADGGRALRRLGAKMATGSGKTVVMSMLIAWTLCNRGYMPSDERFPASVLVVGPNLTVRERLKVLLPEDAENYYTRFDIVPAKYRELLRPGHVQVVNWHKLAPEGAHVEGGKSYAVVNKGEESDEAFARRVLGDAFERGPLLVLNDEAHHAWRPPAGTEVSGEAKEEVEEATIWIDGLDRLNRGVGVRVCADLSATPFYIAGSGQPEGVPFPWLVSDFGLVDAIESGIVKIPRLPVSDTTGRPEPKYFRLWHNITEKLQPADKLPGRAGKPKPEAVWRDAQDALNTLSAQWKSRFEQNLDAGRGRIPPVLIVVCDNTDIARLFYEYISGETQEEYIEDDGGKPKKKTRTVYGGSAVFEEFANTAARRHTLRIDSKLLAAAESDDPEATRDEAAQQLRRIVDTVGRPGEPGEHIRCVVSVSMLTEGWDANNVTHILGLRAFGSQLLCEQVVGRGLRRMDYDPDPETGLLRAEYVDVYGIPFSVIPFKGRSTTTAAPEDKPTTWVRARDDRKHYEMSFPVVEGYVFALNKGLIRCDVDKVELLRLTPDQTPTGVFVKPQVGYQIGAPTAHGPGAAEMQDRKAFYESTHLQTIQFEIARRVVADLASTASGGKLKYASRHQLFPQVYRIVEQFIDRRVDWNGVADPREIGLERYVSLVVERLVEAIRPDTSEGEPPLLPLLNRFQPRASTGAVTFKTTRPCFDTTKSHIDHVVADTQTWEQSASFYLEASEFVSFYARNDHLDLVIPYDYFNVQHQYQPDFIVRLIDGRTLILEIKGAEDEQDRQKHQAAKRWVEAVNNWGQMGRWIFHVCRNPQMLGRELEGLAKGAGGVT